MQVGILGATGYTGRELVRVLSNHPKAEIVYLGTSSAQGKPYGFVYPELLGSPLGDLIMEDESSVPEVDVLFCAVPHGIMASRVAELLARGIRIIDLGADFRLKDPAKYRQWYGEGLDLSDPDHPDPDNLSQAVYGLTEIYREDIAAGSLIANPGCYPTSALLPLIPLLANGLIEHDPIVIDAKSGVSGAGRTPSARTHYCQVEDNFQVYGIDGHRHMPEIEQELSFAAGASICVSFTPHLVPMVRGMMATIYTRIRKDSKVGETDLRHCWQNAYQDVAFVRVMSPGVWPMSKHAFGSNNLYMQVRVDERTGLVVIVSVLDNLVKGASGQAVQNMNVMFGLPEKTGLEMLSLWP
ncbi:MAG: N-acetyl-gamma-glutamyl-phosphate reductase [Peptococcaceae bacterium]|nr:N-acetyl-gamma-glutamyl-phosphate reductase [Peptococcaceae bacterium]